MTDERDPKISRRYRELGAEEPSRELDQAILAAAHRAADKPHAPLVTPAGRHRWYFAFGAAAILVLAVAVTVQIERKGSEPEAVVLDQRASPQALPATEAPGAAVRVEPKKEASPAKPRYGFTAERKQRAQEAPRELAREDRFEAKEAQAPQVESPNREQGANSRDVGPAAPAAVPALQGRVAASAVPLSPERLLERIAELRKEGRHEEADKALAEFRRHYPDYRISEEMLKKVEREK